MHRHEWVTLWMASILMALGFYFVFNGMLW